MKQHRCIWAVSALVVILFACLCFFAGPTSAYSGYFSSRCGACHTDDSNSCGACHRHNGTMTATTDQDLYQANTDVTVTLSRAGGYSGWVRVILYDHDGFEIARAAGPDGTGDNGLGNPVILPQSLVGTAPIEDGEFTWEIAWYGTNDSGTEHIEERYPVTFTVEGSAGVGPWWQATELGPELNLAMFPNPISSSGTLKFSLGAHVDQSASLSIIDPSGRLLRSVTSGTFGTGIQDISWDGTDNSGAILPTGTYYAILSSGGESISRAVTILR